MAMRHLGFDALPDRRPAAQGCHVGFGPGLVDEDETGRVDLGAIFEPLRTPARHIGTFLLGGDQRLFL